jgi:hypothetical protein
MTMDEDRSWSTVNLMQRKAHLEEEKCIVNRLSAESIEKVKHEGRWNKLFSERPSLFTQPAATAEGAAHMSHILYVGTIGEGVFHSTDGGVTFRRAMNGTFVECHVRALVVHPAQPHTLYMGSELGLFRSTNGAEDWQRIDSPLDGLQIWSVLLWPGKPEVLLAGTCPSRMFRSGDGGRSWQETSGPFEKHCPRIMNTRVTSLAADPSDGRSVWAGIEIDSAWRSRDEGSTWQKVPAGLSSADIHGLVVVPASMGRPRRLVAATNNDLNLSDDDGETWRRLDIGKQAPRSYCRGLAQVQGRPERLLLGVGDGPPGSVGFIVVSEDAGASWRAAEMPGPANSTIWNFATYPSDSNLVYASSVSGQVYRSTDAGLSWTKLPREFGEIRALAWAP